MPKYAKCKQTIIVKRQRLLKKIKQKLKYLTHLRENINGKYREKWK